jgi:hypothetical protein
MGFSATRFEYYTFVTLCYENISKWPDKASADMKKTFFWHAGPIAS